MKNKQPEPLLSNADLEKLARGILHLTKDRQFAVYERLVFVRGTYEKELERLHAQLAALRGDDWGKTVDYLISLAPEPEPPLPEPPDDWDEGDDEDRPHYDTPGGY